MTEERKVDTPKFTDKCTRQVPNSGWNFLVPCFSMNRMITTSPKTSAKDTTMLPGVLPNPSPRLLDQVRDRIRVLHYSMRTEATYPKWIKRFILISVKATQNGLD